MRKPQVRCASEGRNKSQLALRHGYCHCHSLANEHLLQAVTPTGSLLLVTKRNLAQVRSGVLLPAPCCLPVNRPGGSQPTRRGAEQRGSLWAHKAQPLTTCLRMSPASPSSSYWLFPYFLHQVSEKVSLLVKAEVLLGWLHTIQRACLSTVSPSPGPFLGASLASSPPPRCAPLPGLCARPPAAA